MDFQLQRDNMLIAKGSHFFCGACLVAVPLEEQSKDPRYCWGCKELLLYEASLKPEEKKKVSETASEVFEALPEPIEGVTKIPNKGIHTKRNYVTS